MTDWMNRPRALERFDAIDKRLDALESNMKKRLTKLETDLAEMRKAVDEAKPKMDPTEGVLGPAITMDGSVVIDPSGAGFVSEDLGSIVSTIPAPQVSEHADKLSVEPPAPKGTDSGD